jgi:hypothetical protein
MSQEPGRPDIELPKPPDIKLTVLAYTAEIAMARPWGLVTGSGPKPHDAVNDMCKQALVQGRKIYEMLWYQERGSKSPWRDKITKKAKQGQENVTLKGAVSIGSARLAYGDTGCGHGWVAYGTLLTDSTGDGSNWLQPEKTEQRPEIPEEKK